MDNKVCLPVVGAFTVTLTDKDGNVKMVREVKNTVVTAGKAYLASFLAADPASGSFMAYIGIGDGSTGATAADTALESETAREEGSKSSSTNVLTNSVVFAAGVGTGDVSEAGLFSASSGGTMFARQTFASVPKSATDAITVSWQVTLG